MLLWYSQGKGLFASIRKAPEGLLLPWYSQGNGLFASIRKVRTSIPISSPVWFDFSRHLNDWVARVFVSRGYLWSLGQLWCTAVMVALQAGLATTCFSLAYLWLVLPVCSRSHQTSEVGNGR